MCPPSRSASMALRNKLIKRLVQKLGIRCDLQRFGAHRQVQADVAGRQFVGQQPLQPDEHALQSHAFDLRHHAAW